MPTTDPPKVVPPPKRNVSAPRRPISAAAALAEPPAEQVFPPDEELPPITDAERKAAAAELRAATTPRPQITCSTTVEYRGRLITIQASDMTADQFCDILDKRGYAVPAQTTALAAPVATPDDLPDGWKLCKRHGAPMRPRTKQGDTWHSHNVGTSDNPIYCKGYKGADSPGFDL